MQLPKLTVILGLLTASLAVVANAQSIRSLDRAMPPDAVHLDCRWTDEGEPVPIPVVFSASQSVVRMRVDWFRASVTDDLITWTETDGDEYRIYRATGRIEGRFRNAKGEVFGASWGVCDRIEPGMKKF